MRFRTTGFAVWVVLSIAACSTPSKSTATNSVPGGRPNVAARPAPKLEVHAPPAEDFDVENYALDLALHPESKSIDASATIRLWPRGETLAKVALDLVDLKVDGVRDGRGRELKFTYDGAVLSIELADQVKRGDFVELAIRYGGAPTRGLYFVADRGSGPTQVFTQGECEDARYWYPCWDHPGDRATSSVRVNLPPKWTSIAAGERIDHQELAGGRSVDLWRMTTPHAAYLETLCAGEFAVAEKTWENVPLLYAVEPSYAPMVDSVFDETPKILQFFSDVTGYRYPYAKYAQVCVDEFPFGGMENISATTLTDTALRDELGLRDAPSYDLIAHEAAHQWFGDLMTCADWSHIWLNESFATYFDLLYDEAAHGEDEFLERVRSTLEGYVAADVGPARRPTVWNVWREPMDLFFEGGLTYGGGALRLNHLRYLLGDATFFRGIREYVGANAGRNVLTEDFEHAMEKASGQDLEWFFKQWFYSRGYPEFRVAWKYEDATHELALDVEQVQNSADGTPSVFRAPVEVLWGDSSHSSARIEVTERHQVFKIPAPAAPTWCDFDPHGRVPHRAQVAHTREEANAMASSDDPSVRADGALELVRVLNDKQRSERERGAALAGLMRVGSDPHAADVLRRAMVTALSLCANAELAQAATEALHDDGEDVTATLASRAIAEARERTANDPSASVRAAAWQTLSGFLPNDEAVAAARKEVLESPFSWQTRLAAARLVALSDKEHAGEWIRQCLAIHSPHGEFESGLFGVLVEIAGDQAAPVLMQVIGDPKSIPSLRAAAVRLLGAHGRSVAGARQSIESVLLSDDYRLRSAALDALQSLRDPGCVPALRELAKRALDSRHRLQLERILASDWAGA